MGTAVALVAEAGVAGAAAVPVVTAAAAIAEVMAESFDGASARDLVLGASSELWRPFDA